MLPLCPPLHLSFNVCLLSLDAPAFIDLSLNLPSKKEPATKPFDRALIMVAWKNTNRQAHSKT
jgi:hypothetical protein